MDRQPKMKPLEIVLNAAQELPPAEQPRIVGNVADALRALHGTWETETKNKAEVDELIRQLLTLNSEKKEAYRRHAEARIERNAHNTAQAQVEADEREALIDKERDVMMRIGGKLRGIHPHPIALAGQVPSNPRPPRKRGFLRRLFGVR
jgi:hypothetical protein